MEASTSVAIISIHWKLDSWSDPRTTRSSVPRTATSLGTLNCSRQCHMAGR